MSATAARDVVSRFIAALGRRDAAAVNALLADACELVFPGPTVFRDFGSFAAWAATRYRSADYAYDQLDVVLRERSSLVYASGTLSGTFLNSERFSAVRFIDRFEVSEGRIVRKEAWSDMADLLRRSGK